VTLTNGEGGPGLVRGPGLIIFRTPHFTGLRHTLGDGTQHRSSRRFADAIGKPIEASSLIRQTLHPLLRAAGLPRIRFHDLRHSATTILLESGAHPRVVAERLGHATPSLVMNVYGHATERMQGEATAALERARWELDAFWLLHSLLQNRSSLISEGRFSSSGGRIRTSNQRINSPLRYRCATPELDRHCNRLMPRDVRRT
jgi:Phage integrase family